MSFLSACGGSSKPDAGIDAGPIDDTAASVEFETQPQTALVGAVLAPVRLVVKTASGALVKAPLRVSVSLVGGTTATLSGAMPQTLVSGAVTFDRLSVDRARRGYSLQISVEGLAAIESMPFDIESAPPTKIRFVMQPATGVVGALAPVTVVLSDADFSPSVTSNAEVTLTLSGGAPGAMLMGTLRGRPVDGVVSFSDLRLEKAGARYVLAAETAGLPTATSSEFSLQAAAADATRSTLTVNPATVAASATTSLDVLLRDAFDNPVASQLVTFTASGTNNTFAPTGTTDARGQLRTAFRSLTAERKTVTATSGPAALTASFDVTPLPPRRPGVFVEGLSSSSVTLALTGQPDLVIAAGTTIASFANPLQSGTTYAVSIATQPTGLRCLVLGASGTVSTTEPVVRVRCGRTGWTRVRACSLGLRADGSLWSFEGAEPSQVGVDTNWQSVIELGGSFYGVKSDGTLWSWGSNLYGQLGDGTKTPHPAPAQVGSDTNWVSVTPRTFGAFGLRSDGTLWAWGGNAFGEIGDGTTTERLSPVQVGTANDWASVTVVDFVVGLRTDGSLWSWGRNFYGQLGDGSTTNRNTPTQEATLSSWSSVSITTTSTYAIRSDGSLWAWGNNAAGQLGDGAQINRSTPVRIGTANDWASVMVTSGGQFAIARKTNGTLWAWGVNQYGQLGDGSIISRLTPVQVGTATNWASVRGAGESVLAVRSDGSLWSWGRDQAGTLGLPAGGDVLAPVQVGTNTDWSSVDTGLECAMALTNDGALWSWGDVRRSNRNPSLGRRSLAPRPLSGGRAWASVSAGDSWTTAIALDGTLWSWGLNLQSQLGDGTTTRRLAPVQVGSDTTWDLVSSGPDWAVGRRTGGTLWGWGQNAWYQLGNGGMQGTPTPTPVAGNTMTWAAVSTGGGSGCAGSPGSTLATRSDGSLWAWGNNFCGQLGLGNSVASVDAVTRLGTASNWASVATNKATTIATRTDGTLWIWGQYYNGTTTMIQTSPLQVGTNNNWARVVAGGALFAIRRDGSLWGWGDNTDGQIGDGTTTRRALPVQIGTDTDWASVVSVGAGGGFASRRTFALKTNGTLWAWGRNDLGQFGDGSTTSRTSPVQVGTATHWAAIAASDTHAVAVTTGGALWGWGSNNYGESGDAPNVLPSLVP